MTLNSDQSAAIGNRLTHFIEQRFKPLLQISEAAAERSALSESHNNFVAVAFNFCQALGDFVGQFRANTLVLIFNRLLSGLGTLSSKIIVPTVGRGVNNFYL